MLKRTLTHIVVLAFIVTFMSANAAKAQLVTDGLISYWPLDQDTVQGKTVKDVWGENDGTLAGNPKVEGGKVGGALKVGGGDSVDIPGTKSLNFAKKEAMTVMAWINAGSDEPVQGVVAGCCGTIVAQRDANGWALRYDGRNPGQEMEFIVQPGWQGDGGFGAPRFKKGEWHHLTGVVDRTKLLLYVDGEFLLEMPYAGPMVGDSSETEIGHAGDGGFVGLIDEVAIYSKALSAKEVKQSFQAQGLAVAPAGKLATRWGEIKAFR
jgi:hypothetical protein